MTVKKVKKRYILVRFIGEIPSKVDFDKKVRSNFRYYFGEINLIRSNFHIVEEVNDCFILRSNLPQVEQVEAIITLINSENYIADIIGKSGTIKGLKRKFNDYLSLRP